MTPNPAPQQDIISPGEAKFWQEWAVKAPALIRDLQKTTNNEVMPYQITQIAAGSALGIATFTKAVKGKWKVLSGAASAGLLGVAGMTSVVKNANNKLLSTYADHIEKNPQAQQELADYLSRTMTGDMIQKMGIEEAVKIQTSNAVNELPSFRLEYMLRRDTGKGFSEFNNSNKVDGMSINHGRNSGLAL